MEILDFIMQINRIEQKLDSVMMEIANTKKPHEKDLLNREEACIFLNISKTTLNQWQKSGLIRKYKMPNSRRVYYLKTDLELAIKKAAH